VSHCFPEIAELLLYIIFDDLMLRAANNIVGTLYSSSCDRVENMLDRNTYKQSVSQSITELIN